MGLPFGGGGSVAAGPGVTVTGRAIGTGAAAGAAGVPAGGTTGIARGGGLPDPRRLEDSELDIRDTFLRGFWIPVAYLPGLCLTTPLTSQV